MVNQMANMSCNNIPADIQAMVDRLNKRITVCDHDYSIDFTKSCSVFGVSVSSIGGKVFKCSKCTGLKYIPSIN